ncbi:hypothetical protein ACFQRC_13290 [Enterovirga sp. GCM10030262]|uniref:hypothetical protein n=1 Tax=Enterovirga sp. GCM10030262 TaxID=3273391 RepID=UPI003616382C
MSAIRCFRFLAFAPLAAGLLSAQAPPPLPADPATLGDEFDGIALAPEWSLFHSAYGWPDKIKALDVGAAEPGVLTLQPYHSAWVRDLNAPFLFKTVAGDFDVRARVRVRGLDGAVPGGTWSLGGLMVRVPNGIKAEAWKPRAENWHFITTGVGHEPGRTMTETKGTYNSYSSLKLRPYGSGWMELRLVRVGMALFALARPDESSPWEVRDRFYRMEGSPYMQVGLIAYTHSVDVPDEPEDAGRINALVLKDARVDMALDVDWIRFSRPQAPPVNDWYAQVNGTNKLADPNLPEAELLAALGA